MIDKIHCIPESKRLSNVKSKGCLFIVNETESDGILGCCLSKKADA
jgi:hypothetical protein